MSGAETGQKLVDLVVEYGGSFKESLEMLQAFSWEEVEDLADVARMWPIHVAGDIIGHARCHKAVAENDELQQLMGYCEVPPCGECGARLAGYHFSWCSRESI